MRHYFDGHPLRPPNLEGSDAPTEREAPCVLLLKLLQRDLIMDDRQYALLARQPSAALQNR
ncbi:hypothetical protein, partial [Pseudomonas corrugata]|uniref:hypothetical protein n=1 Tax=Pseudomonas corrugata TaxID=47879 RepID=UPI001F523760